MNKKYLIVITVLVILLLIGLVGLNIYSVTSMPRDNSSIKIGGIFAMTGLGASQGEEEQKGATLAVYEINKNGGINGRPLELITEDVSLDKLSAAVSVARKLIDVDKVKAIVGTTWDEPAEVIVPIIQKAEIPMIGQNQTRTVKGKNPFPYFFSTWYNNEIGVRELLKFSKSKGWKNIAIIRPIAGGFYQYISDKVSINAKEFDITIIDDINLNNPTTSDFRTPLVKLKSKNPDAILLVLNGFTECPFLKQTIELGIKAPILSTEAAGDYPSLKSCSQFMSNLYFAYPKETPKAQSFNKAYFDKFGTYPETPSVLTAYDAVNIIADALRKTGGESGPILQKTIAETKNYTGVSADNIHFDSIGYVATPSDAFIIKKVIDGEFVEIK